MEKEVITKVRAILGLDEYQKNGPDKLREVFYGDYNLISGAHTNQTVMTNANSNRPILGTYGLGPCIAIVGYDPINKEGYLSHNVPLKNLDDLNDYPLQKLNKNNLEFYLIGGTKEYEYHIKNIKDYLNQKIENPRIVYEDVIETNDPKKMGKSFALDTRNGEIYCLDGVQTI